MFEYYLVVDLFVNLYKKWKVNILVFIVLFVFIVVLFIIKVVKNKNIVKDIISYLIYISYKIIFLEDLVKMILNY